MTDVPIPSQQEEAEIDVDEALVRRLLRGQFPRWAALHLEEVQPRGSVNAMFRLGEEMVVRLTRTSRDSDVDYEVGWLNNLAPHLPLPIPEVLAVGEPGEGYPWQWSVLRWLEGESWRADRVDDPCAAARLLAEFIQALQRLEPVSMWGLTPAEFAPLVTSDTRIAPWEGLPVLAHWDLYPGNVLVRDGRLAAVIDWAAASMGDPARDLMAAWTLFSGEARREFRTAMGFDDDTWARAHAWAGHRVGAR